MILTGEGEWEAAGWMICIDFEWHSWTQRIRQSVYLINTCSHTVTFNITWTQMLHCRCQPSKGERHTNNSRLRWTKHTWVQQRKGRIGGRLYSTRSFETSPDRPWYGSSGSAHDISDPNISQSYYCCVITINRPIHPSIYSSIFLSVQGQRWPEPFPACTGQNTQSILSRSAVFLRAKPTMYRRNHIYNKQIIAE